MNLKVRIGEVEFNNLWELANLFLSMPLLNENYPMRSQGYKESRWKEFFMRKDENQLISRLKEKM